MSTLLLLQRLTSCRYMPILAVRPAEMKALEELPESDKDIMLPHILLRPWLSAGELRHALSKVEESYGERSWVCDIDPYYPRPDEVDGSSRRVFLELEELLNPAGGYSNWCDFCSGLPNVIPSALMIDPNEFSLQVRQLYSLNRGLVVRIPKALFGRLESILDTLVQHALLNIVIILDFGQATASDLASVAIGRTYVEKIYSMLPSAAVAISATTFPDSFVGIRSESIRERAFFNSIRAVIHNSSLIYSDRGSAREERRTGGGGVPSPRIDYPRFDDWKFYRVDSEDGYELAAQDLVADESAWDPSIRIWGTQMIERTADGDRFAIISPVRATAVRINLHMHRQVFYDAQDKVASYTEDEWVD